MTKDSYRAAIIFSVVALALSVLYWMLEMLTGRGLMPWSMPSSISGLARGYGPAAAAVLTAAYVYGKPGVIELLRRVTRWRVPPALLGLALLGPLIANSLVVLIVSLLGAELGFDVHSVPIPKLVLIFFFFAVVDGPIGEEIGWRGFLLPRLLESFSAVKASIIVGVVWWLWHLPLYAATGQFHLTALFLVGYLVNNICFSVLHTWFYLRSGRSAFLAIVFHTAGNYFVYLSITLFPGLDQSPWTRPVYLVILMVAAIVAAFFLQRGPRQTRLDRSLRRE